MGFGDLEHVLTSSHQHSSTLEFRDADGLLQTLGKSTAHQQQAEEHVGTCSSVSDRILDSSELQTSQSMLASCGSLDELDIASA